MGTRGFNGSGNLRMNQLVDGMDNQAPGLNFAVGSVVGIGGAMGAFGIAWPIAVRLAEWLIRSRGYVAETQQSGGAARRDMAGR